MKIINVKGLVLQFDSLSEDVNPDLIIDIINTELSKIGLFHEPQLIKTDEMEITVIEPVDINLN